MAEERYEIRGKIGQGGVGVVYKAYDTQLRREVAIKRVLADELEGDSATATKNLLKEATALSSVQHPHICTVYDAGMDDDGPFVVMELINGKTLDEMVERGSLTYEDFREVAIQTQEAMIAAQELNLVHRDLKPSNVMVSWLPSGRFQIKLVDFGLAKFSAKPSLQTIDHGDAVFGSIFFMAPEQFERTPLDQRTDMYSLGAMYYYSLTGNYPFDGDTAPQVMASHLQNSVIPLQQVRPDLPVWLCEWVMWHIQRNMDHRPESARVALEKYLADESGFALGTLGQPAAPAGIAIPALRRLNTGLQPVTPATSTTSTLPAQAANSPFAPKTITAPQRILSPSGMPSPITSPVAIQPRTTLAPVGIQTPVTGVHQTPATSTEPVPHMPHAAPGKKPLNKTKVIVISSMLTVATVLVSLKACSVSNDNNTVESFQSLIKDIESKNTLTVTQEELNSLLKGMQNDKINSNEKIGGYTAMSRAVAKDDAFSPTLEIAKFVTNPGNGIKGEATKNIFKAIRMNPKRDPEAHKLLLEYALQNPEEDHSAEAIKGMSEFADESFIDGIISVYEKATSVNTRTSCALALTGAIKRSSNKDTIATKLIGKYKGAWNDDQKLAYLRLLGSTGSTEAVKIVYDSLKSTDIAIRSSAFRSLASSPTIEPLDAMLTVYNAEQNEQNLTKYREDIAKLINSVADLTEQQKSDSWLKVLQASPNITCGKHIIANISRMDAPAAKSTLSVIIANTQIKPELIEFAKEKLDSIE